MALENQNTQWAIEEEELAHISSYHMLTTDKDRKVIKLARSLLTA
jgi:hypothetical protein